MEMLTAAKEAGVKALAITDHGKVAGGRLTSVFFERMPEDIVPGIRLLKGIEANIDQVPGKTDVPPRYLEHCDLILLGLHRPLTGIETRQQFTDALIKTMTDCPYVDVITHPNIPSYPVYYEPLAEAARECGVALELNNVKSTLKRASDEDTLEMLEVCAKAGCQIAVNSDAHIIREIGCDDAVRPFLKQISFPEELIVNSNLDSALTWIESRRKNKKK